MKVIDGGSIDVAYEAVYFFKLSVLLVARVVLDTTATTASEKKNILNRDIFGCRKSCIYM